jgi:hypothetical protein
VQRFRGAASLCSIRDSLSPRRSRAEIIRAANHRRRTPMDTKDRFMRIAVVGSVILVGALALAVRLHS